MADQSNNDEAKRASLFRQRSVIIQRAELALMRRNTAARPPRDTSAERRRLRGEPCGE